MELCHPTYNWQFWLAHLASPENFRLGLVLMDFASRIMGSENWWCGDPKDPCKKHIQAPQKSQGPLILMPWRIKVLTPTNIWVTRNVRVLGRSASADSFSTRQSSCYHCDPIRITGTRETFFQETCWNTAKHAISWKEENYKRGTHHGCPGLPPFKDLWKTLNCSKALRQEVKLWEDSVSQCCGQAVPEATYCLRKWWTSERLKDQGREKKNWSMKPWWNYRGCGATVWPLCRDRFCRLWM